MVIRLRRLLVPVISLLAVAAVGVVAGCVQGEQVVATPTPTPYIEISVAIPCQLAPGDSIPISLRGQVPAGAAVAWEADAGTIATQGGAVAVYTAPDKVATDEISAQVNADGESRTISVTCTILLPPTATATATPVPTDTPAPTDTPPPSPTATETPTPTPSPTPVPTLEPVACANFRVAAGVFPDFATGETFVSANTDYFTCEGVDDPLGERERVVHVDYEVTGNRDDFGSMGFVLGEYDASTFEQLCVSTHALEPQQAVWLKLKDVNGNEGRARLDVPGGGWSEQCVPLSVYADQGVDVTRLENVSVGFDQELDSIEVWLDDILFK